MSGSHELEQPQTNDLAESLKKKNKRYIPKVYERMQKSDSFLSQSLSSVISQDALRLNDFANQAGLDRTVLYRIATGETRNPGLMATAKILTTFGKEEAYRILQQAVPIEFSHDHGWQLFPEDSFIAEGNFGQQLRTYRKKSGLVADDLQAVGVNVDKVSLYELNKARPRFHDLSLFVFALGLNPDQAFALLEEAANPSQK